MHEYLVLSHRSDSQAIESLSFQAKKELIQAVAKFYEQLRQDGTLIDEFLFTDQLTLQSKNRSSDTVSNQHHDNIYGSGYRIKSENMSSAQTITSKDPRYALLPGWSVLIIEIETIESARQA